MAAREDGRAHGRPWWRYAFAALRERILTRHCIVIAVKAGSQKHQSFSLRFSATPHAGQ
jgi:hypothetical protein